MSARPIVAGTVRCHRCAVRVGAVYGDFDTYLHKGLMLDDATIAALKAKLLV